MIYLYAITEQGAVLPDSGGLDGAPLQLLEHGGLGAVYAYARAFFFGPCLDFNSL